MEIRLATFGDKEEIEQFCKNKGFNFPFAQSLYIVRDKGRIIALGGLEYVIKIEPLISENKIAAGRLYLHLIELLKKANINKIEAFTTDDKMEEVKDLYKKHGFAFVGKPNRFIKHLED